MIGRSIAERFCDTTNPRARQLLQDAAAVFGAQGVVGEQLEDQLTDAEANEILLDNDVEVRDRSEPCNPGTPRGRLRHRFDGRASSAASFTQLRLGGQKGLFPSRRK